jgi:hypothetical protein
MRKLRDRGLALLACGVLAMLGACNRESQDEMGWARAALERNSALEVVAADPKTHTFTVRDKATGAVSTIRADAVVGAPTVAASSAPAVSAAPSPAAAPATLSSAPPAAAAPAESAAAPPAPSDSAPAAMAQAEHAQSTSLAPQSATIAAESASGRVLESGPGYTIKAASATVAANGAGARDSGITSAPLERRYEPIVCQGARLLHIDNRNLAFTGDAVAAEDGCEIHITNSRISATGVGVSARAANVHIDNSMIEGDQASIDASEGAQVYAESSHFKGLSRQLDSAGFHDLGGNIWN